LFVARQRRKRRKETEEGKMRSRRGEADQLEGGLRVAEGLLVLYR
jgi:hypothetical protein